MIFTPVPYPYFMETYETLTAWEMIHILWIYGVGFMVLAFLAWALVNFIQIAWRSIWFNSRGVSQYARTKKENLDGKSATTIHPDQRSFRN